MNITSCCGHLDSECCCETLYIQVKSSNPEIGVEKLGCQLIAGKI